MFLLNCSGSKSVSFGNRLTRPSTAIAACIAFVLAVQTHPAAAQTSSTVTLGSPPNVSLTESVTVEGVKSVPESVINNFVRSYTTPTRAIGKIARWKSGICPVTTGLAPQFAKFVTQRVKIVAEMVGAPLDGREACEDNLDIVFTTSPQGLLDNIRKNRPVYLGYHDNSAEADQMARVTHLVQAWYTTETSDLTGKPEIDAPHSGGIEVTLPTPPPGFAGQMSGPTQGFYTLRLSQASAHKVTGSRLGDGLSSAYYHVIIVADPNKLREYEIGAVADYIAMLALSQPQSLDLCQDLPSITNLLVPGCQGSNVASSLTSADMAFLRGLYKMTFNGTLRQQRDEIAYQMNTALAGH